MPRFHIDTSAQNRLVRDDAGHEFPNLEAAKTVAVKALTEIAQETMPDGDTRPVFAIVRGEDGSTLLEARLTLRVTSPMPGVQHCEGAPDFRPSVVSLHASWDVEGAASAGASKAGLAPPAGT